MHKWKKKQRGKNREVGLTQWNTGNIHSFLVAASPELRKEFAEKQKEQSKKLATSLSTYRSLKRKRDHSKQIT